jgi:predicted metalloprotease with PDZ domain
MIKYLMYQKNPASHYIYIDMFVDNINSETMQLQLPAWRPGRYELGNFAKNVKRVDVFNEKNEVLNYSKLNKDLWQINTENCSSIKVTYGYYAAELNAGACFADTSQIYVNPVHCCMYVPERMHEEHRVELNIPDNYKIATSLKTENKILTALTYEELVDSPFMASADLQSDFYIVENIKFYVHFIGECRPDLEKIKKDFSAFTKTQIGFWGGCPVNEYHFLFQVLPHKFYHGVEHQKSTVIAIGPGFAVNTGPTYEDVLGVSCHELFHAWNVKCIRPVEMLPYDYTKENYARTGYVYEGFTTYYGDKLLLSSGVFSLHQYFETLQERLVKHFHNYGRYNLSVADSSWENWLDGYTPGSPYRKTSIYDEGNLIAFMLDVKIMEATNDKKSLRDVCVLLYERFGKLNKGYSEQDIIHLVNEVSGKDFTDFFKLYVYSPADFEIPLKECFEYLEIEFSKEKNAHDNEHYFGFKVIEHGHIEKVSLVAPYSPAWKAGLFAGDEIIAINGIILKNNFYGWVHYFSQQNEITLTINSNEHLKTLKLEKDKKGNSYFFNPVLQLKSEKNGVNNALGASFNTWKLF